MVAVCSHSGNHEEEAWRYTGSQIHAYAPRVNLHTCRKDTGLCGHPIWSGRWGTSVVSLIVLYASYVSCLLFGLGQYCSFCAVACGGMLWECPDTSFQGNEVRGPWHHAVQQITVFCVVRGTCFMRVSAALIHTTLLHLTGGKTKAQSGLSCVLDTQLRSQQ